ncbi:MAG TPA: 50S ribosomal protein L24 [Clostridiales bacterium]|nr:50S ribosomal protein L24 [Clostridiales bacterium]
MEIKKGDKVVVLTGKDKGKKADVIKAYPADNKVVLEGLNMVTKHVKPRSANQPGGKTTQPAAIDVSNVMLVCPECGAQTKIAHEKVNGKNVRKCKKCGAILDGKTTKKATAKKATAKKSTKKVAEAALPATEEAVTEEPKKAPVKKTAVKKTTKKSAE